MNPLHRLLVERIRRDGPITFRDFMAEALYHPQHGYYTSGRPWEGRGDFATAPAYSALFAASLARFLGMAKEAMGPRRFEVVEVGSGSGLLASQLRPLLADRGMVLRSVEHRRPPLLGRDVPWSASLEGLDVRGALLSNELFDALPVHRLRRGDAGLEELWVAARGDALVPHWGLLSRPEVAAHAERYALAAEPGSIAEVNLDAPAMLRRMLRALDQGIVLTIDYGDDAAALAQRPGGTLTALRDHRLSTDPLADPGLQDLTAHVNFTALRDEGRALGLEVVAEVPQWRFLAATGALDDIAAKLQGPGFAEALAAKTLVTPGGMGEFRVLVQAKGLAEPARARLARRLTFP